MEAVQHGSPIEPPLPVTELQRMKFGLQEGAKTRPGQDGVPVPPEQLHSDEDPIRDKSVGDLLLGLKQDVLTPGLVRKEVSGQRDDNQHRGSFSGEWDHQAHIPSEIASHQQASDTESMSSQPPKETDPGQAFGRSDAKMAKLAAELLEQYDPSRMKLTEEEYEWAIAVKAAIEKIPDLDNVSDLMCAKLAIYSKGNVGEAVARAYRLQAFKRQNDILDTFDDGLRNLPIGPAFLSFDYNLQTGGYILAIDIARIDGSVYKEREKFQSRNRMSFYACHMLFCDLAALRAGVTILCECEGHKLGNSVDLTSYRKTWAGALAYPVRVEKVRFFNSPRLLTAVMLAANTVLPKEITSKYQFCDKCPLGRLDKLYELPTPEIARERLRQRLTDLLARWYANEMHFVLQKESGAEPDGHTFDRENG